MQEKGGNFVPQAAGGQQGLLGRRQTKVIGLQHAQGAVVQQHMLACRGAPGLEHDHRWAGTAAHADLLQGQWPCLG